MTDDARSDDDRPSGARRSWEAILEWPSWARMVTALAIAVAIAAIVQAVQLDEDSTAERITADDLRALTSRTVVYELEGTVAYADITMITPTGMEQISADVPLTNQNGARGLTFTDFEPGAFVSIAAQKPDEGGSITCRITVDGQVVAENTSTAAFGIASCDGNA